MLGGPGVIPAPATPAEVRKNNRVTHQDMVQISEQSVKSFSNYPERNPVGGKHIRVHKGISDKCPN